MRQSKMARAANMDHCQISSSSVPIVPARFFQAGVTTAGNIMTHHILGDDLPQSGVNFSCDKAAMMGLSQ
jgi:hypothetical protein